MHSLWRWAISVRKNCLTPSGSLKEFGKPMMSMTNLRTDIAVIGGGAAGLMAAITAAEAGAQVIVIEKGEQPLRKLKITGKGRCNITNNCTVSELLLNIPRNGRFL
ncbi:MAG: FAD-binding protein, partial [Papillibacter sp.]|nr:FAD-binding protein [Papillibacter sp.]